MSMHKFYRNKLIWIVTFYVVYFVVVSLSCYFGFWSIWNWETIGLFWYSFAFIPTEILAVIFLIREIKILNKSSAFTIIALIAGIVPFILMAVDIPSHEVGHIFLGGSGWGWNEIGMIFTVVAWLCWLGEYIAYKATSRTARKKSDGDEADKKIDIDS